MYSFIYFLFFFLFISIAMQPNIYSVSSLPQSKQQCRPNISRHFFISGFTPSLWRRLH